MIEELFRQHLRIVGAGIFYLTYPRVFDLRDDEAAGLAFGDIVETLIVDRSLPHGFRLRADDVVGGCVETLAVPLKTQYWY